MLPCVWASHPRISITHRRALTCLLDELSWQNGRALVTPEDHEDHTEDGDETRAPALLSTFEMNFYNFPTCVKSIQFICHGSRPGSAAPKAEECGGFASPEEVPALTFIPWLVIIIALTTVEVNTGVLPAQPLQPCGAMDLEVKDVNGSNCLSQNESDGRLSASSSGVSTALASVLIFTIVVDILGNVLVILSVYRNKKLRNAGEKQSKRWCADFEAEPWRRDLFVCGHVNKR